LGLPFGPQAKHNPKAPKTHYVFIDEPNFPTIETAILHFEDVKQLMDTDDEITRVNFEQLHQLVAAPNPIDLIIWPYGSAMTDKAWPDLFRYLQNGGNLISAGRRTSFVVL
jgi:hypothetical protein